LGLELSALELGGGDGVLEAGHIGDLDHQVVARLVLLGGNQVHLGDLRGPGAGLIG